METTRQSDECICDDGLNSTGGRSSISMDDDNTIIRHMVIKWDIPHEIMNRLIGKNEKETKRLIMTLDDCLCKISGREDRYIPQSHGKERQDIEDKIVFMRKFGYSYREIASKLNKDGLRNSRGGPWSYELVRITFLKYC